MQVLCVDDLVLLSVDLSWTPVAVVRVAGPVRLAVDPLFTYEGEVAQF